MRRSCNLYWLLRTGLLFAGLALVAGNSQPCLAWGRNAHRLIVNKAVDTLPSDVRGFFETNRGFLMQHVTDPLDSLSKNPSEKKEQFIALDKYGRSAAQLQVGSHEIRQIEIGDEWPPPVANRRLQRKTDQRV